MVQDCKFNEKVDIAPVTPNLSIKLDATLNNLVIKDTGIVTSDNGIETTTQVIGRVSNVFDAFDAQKMYANSKQE